MFPLPMYPAFAIAGLLAAAGPILIHLLNRRRYRQVEWAAMDFLREAISRSRRILQMQDLLLLALRTLCILAFGFAMSRPFFGSAVGPTQDGQPVHAVLLIDNSLSMGYIVERSVDGNGDKTLLDEAKQQARELIEELPSGSRISVLSTCGPAGEQSNDAYFTPEDALAALEKIRPIDRAAQAYETIDNALQACGRVREPGGKKIVLFTDQQVSDWPTYSLQDQLEKLPGPIRVVQVKPDREIKNAWIADFRLRHGVADLQTPAVFLAKIRYEGPYTEHDVKVKLTINGEPVFESPGIDLQPGQERLVEFEPHTFRGDAFESLQDPDWSKGKVGFATAEVSVSIDDDGLPADNRRFLVVPVVSSLPVVFIDQWGEAEDPARNRYGETYHLRRLLAPRTTRLQQNRQLLDVKRRTIDQLDQTLLEDARLVVIAGIKSPGSESPSGGGNANVDLLRDYVRQGGNLVIAAGGRFDPDAWNRVAWREGLGILPAPLGSTVGEVPRDVSDASDRRVEFFGLDFDSLKNHHYFRVEGVPEEELRDMLQGPVFYKAIEALAGDDVRKAMAAKTAEEIEQRNARLQEIRRDLTELGELQKRQGLAADQRDRQAALESERAELKPAWLLCSGPEQSGGRQHAAGESGGERFSVIARYNKNSVDEPGGLPFMVQRPIGRGNVLLITTSVSGVHPSWNTLPNDRGAAWVYYRILRGMLQKTLPERTVSSQGDFVLPVSAASRNARITLVRPNPGQRRGARGEGGAAIATRDTGQLQETLPVDPVSLGGHGETGYGVTVSGLTQRGIYRIAADRTADSVSLGGDEGGLDTRLWEIPLAVNGPPGESQLLSTEEIARRHGRGKGDALETVRAFSVSNFQESHLQAANLWKWLVAAVLACLLLELAILALPRAERETPSRSSVSLRGETEEQTG